MPATFPTNFSNTSRAFAEGAQHQVGGGVVGDNPYTAATPEARAWQDGFYAAVGPTAQADATAYALGQIVTSDTPTRTYLCIGAGTSGTGTGPTGTAPAIVDGTVTWQYMGTGDNVDVGAAGITRAGSPPYIGNHANA